MLLPTIYIFMPITPWLWLALASTSNFLVSRKFPVDNEGTVTDKGQADSKNKTDRSGTSGAQQNFKLGIIKLFKNLNL